MLSLPIVAIIGQPNAGKSALFNKIIGKRHSIIANEAGTTRDRIYHTVEMSSLNFILVDTGGLSFEKKDTDFEMSIQNQARLALDEADIIIFAIDSKHPLTSRDFQIADILRKKNDKKIHVFTVLTKCDRCSNDIIQECVDIYQLSFGEPICTSVFHHWGIDELKNRVVKELKKMGFKRETKKEKITFGAKVALVGKPNVGKSSLTNAYLKQDKILVSDIPGTTRDSVDTHISYLDTHYNFIDTAGVRRRGKVERGIEKFSVMRTIEAIIRSDVVLTVIDASQNITAQDQHIVEETIKAKKGIILVINKWDLREKGEDEQERYIRYLRRKFIFIPWAPVLFVSAKTKRHLPKVFPLIDQIVEERKKRIKTSELNNFLKKIQEKHPPAGLKRVRPKLHYITQPETEPPTFIVFGRHMDTLHFSYKRYLENHLREKFGFNGTVINVQYKESE